MDDSTIPTGAWPADPQAGGPPATPPPPPRRRRPRGATLVTMAGLGIGGMAGGFIVSQAATGTTPSPSPAASSNGPSTQTPRSNEDPTHEQGESSQQEQAENNGTFRGGHGGPRGLAGEDLNLVANAIGISTSQLQTELASGKTIAQVAGAHNASVSSLIAAWVASENKEIDDRVSAGSLTQAQATQAKAMTTQRVTDEVNGTLHGGPHGGPWGGAQPGTGTPPPGA